MLPFFPLLCLMSSCTPRFTLFPYTTLFRSSMPHVRQTHGTVPLDVNTPLYMRGSGHVTAAYVIESALEDRKSTRLNSSHLVISYAVFCLKKKLKEDNIDIHKLLQ